MISNYIKTFSDILSNTKITDQTGKVLSEEMAFSNIIEQFKNVQKSGKTVFLIGNGGSSGIVSHSSIDFMNACMIKAFPITDNSQITCFANDYGYENVYRKPLEIMFQEGDALIAVSSSGSSKNIVNASQTASEKGGFVLTLSGFKKENLLRKSGHINFWIDVEDYGIVEIGHALLLHIITDELQKHTKK
ncbi:SIS domain-containing protein [Bacteroidota bacterium]